MKKRKKDTGLSLQASISEKEKRTVTSGFLAIVPVCYMILGVFGWMKTALGIINVVYDADLLYGVLLAAGIWMGILYLMKKRQFLLLLLTLAVTPILVWDAFFRDPRRILGDQQGFPVRNDSAWGCLSGDR